MKLSQHNKLLQAQREIDHLYLRLNILQDTYDLLPWWKVFLKKKILARANEIRESIKLLEE